MKSENAIQQKSFDFGLRIIKLNDFLKANHVDDVLCKQVLRSGTSIGANVEEAIGAQTRNEFYSKLTIAYKEARETKYWIGQLGGSCKINRKLADSFLNDCEEILKLIGSIQKTLKSGDDKGNP